MVTVLSCVVAVISSTSSEALAQRRKRGATTETAAAAPAQAAAKTITVRTEPKALVWLDEVRRGAADDAGQLVINNVSPGRHTLRVRATNFQERTVGLLPAQRGTVEVRLTRTTNEAEILFQRAEDAREGRTGSDGTREDAAELYRRALALRPRFPAAHVGLARVLLTQDDHDGALEQIEEARRDRPSYAEASAVEGRILREMGDRDAAVRSYQRSIRESRGAQPEAHTGLGIVLEDKGDYEGAVAAFSKAIGQLGDTEPVLYQLIGAAYERIEKYKEALAAYEKYLELAPDGRHASAIRSIIDQLRQQAADQPNP
ncbi:MAG: tetratricopeptide repeat protein [Pyrinomonadaceae bacterium]